MMSNFDRLVYMANQIATNFGTRHPDEAAAATAHHIHDFWDPRMRRLIFEHLDKGGEGLNDVAKAALTQLQEKRAAV